MSDIFDSIKGFLTLNGVHVGLGTGLSLSKWKVSPYLVVNVLRGSSSVSLGPILNTLGEFGLSLGKQVELKTKAKKFKLWVDLAAVTDGPQLLEKLRAHGVPKLGLFAGFRLTF